MLSVIYEPKVLMVLSIVGFLVLVFLWSYVRPALSVARSLKKACRNIRLYGGDRSSKKGMADNFKHSMILLHCWSEYAETLHAQKCGARGESGEDRLRSTMPADTFFSSSTVIDNALGTDFFKHLPGILTGIGIIGTFWGLIDGLQGFDAGGSVEELRSKIGLLLNGVKAAFVASTCAIVAAILVTALEKFLLNMCSKRLADLTQKIDELYEAGAGEEYLARLVGASEESSEKSRVLKDALVEDLGGIFVKMSESLSRSFHDSLAMQINRQIVSQREVQEQVSKDIVSAISRSLAPPMTEFTRVSSELGLQHGQAITLALDAAMAKVESGLSQHMSGLGDLMGGGAEAMRKVQGQFTALVDRISDVGADTTAGAAAHMQVLMAEAEKRQQTMNERFLSMLEQVRESVLETQGECTRILAVSVGEISRTTEALLRQVVDHRQAIGETGKASLEELQGGLSALIEEVQRSSLKTTALYESEFQRLTLGMASGQQIVSGEMVRQLEVLQQRAEEIDASRQERVDRQLTRLLDHLAGTISLLTTKIGDNILETRDVVERLENITVVGSETMISGAVAIKSAASELGAAGAQVADALTLGAQVIRESASSASEGLESSTGILKELMASYRHQREQCVSLISSLQSMIKNAEEKAGAGQEIVADMTALVAKGREFQESSAGYLANINGILSCGFDTFSKAIGDNTARFREDIDRDASDLAALFSNHLKLVDESLQRLIETINKHAGSH